MAKRSKPAIKRPRGKRRRHEKEGKPLLPPGSSAGSAQSRPQPAQEVAAAAAPPSAATTSAARAPKGPSLVVDSDLPPPVQHTSELPDRLQTFLADRSLAAPTEVQRRCWPACLAGRDLVCVAPTGSGKTLGYLLPLLERLRTARAAAQRPAAGRPVALVLVPTRELAQQVAAACAPMLRLFGIRVEAVHGGDESRPRQLARLRGGEPPPALLVATPGRLLDLATEGGGHEGGGEGGGDGGGEGDGDGESGDGGDGGVLDLSGVGYFVMDEADKMLTGGLLEQATPRRTAAPPTRAAPSLSAPSLSLYSLSLSLCTLPPQPCASSRRTLSPHPPSAGGAAERPSRQHGAPDAPLLGHLPAARARRGAAPAAPPLPAPAGRRRDRRRRARRRRARQARGGGRGRRRG